MIDPDIVILRPITDRMAEEPFLDVMVGYVGLPIKEGQDIYKFMTLHKFVMVMVPHEKNNEEFVDKLASCAVSIEQSNCRLVEKTELAKTQERIATLEKGIRAVMDLINDSQGVAGLHRNGDVADWSNLRSGGSFEDLLLDFDDACDILDK